MIRFDGTTAVLVDGGREVMRGALSDCLARACGAKPRPILSPPGALHWLDASGEERELLPGTSRRITRADLEGAAKNLARGRAVVVDREHQSITQIDAETVGWAHRGVLVEYTHRDNEAHLYLLCELNAEASRDVASGDWPFGSVVVEGTGSNTVLVSHALSRYPVQSGLLPSTAVRSTYTRGLSVRAARPYMEEEKAQGEKPEEMRSDMPEGAPAEPQKRALSPDDEAMLMQRFEAAGLGGDMPLSEKLDALIKSAAEAMVAEMAADPGESDEVAEMRSKLSDLDKVRARLSALEAEKAERDLSDAVELRAKTLGVSLSAAQRSDVLSTAREVPEKVRAKVIDTAVRALNVPTSGRVMTQHAPPETALITSANWRAELEKRAADLTKKDGLRPFDARLRALKAIKAERPDLVPVIDGAAGE